jgi:hypothetical protein
MKTRTFILILIFNTLSLINLSVLAQAPDKFNYQAILRDASGNARISATVNIEISILQSSATGTAIYTETHSAVTNSFGLVNLQIGGGTVTLGAFASIDWAAGPYYLKITVDGTDFGTSQLVSVPYAKYAEKAGNSFSGNYSDLSEKPSLATVATSGSYTDLTNKPELFDGTWTSLTGKPTTVAGYGITNAVTTSGDQTIAGVKTFSSTVKADSIYLTKKTTKWNFHAHSLRVQVTSAGSNIAVSYIGEDRARVIASNTGTYYVFMPLDLPSQILGCEQKIKSVTFNYQCLSTSVYITNVILRKYQQDDLTNMISSSNDRTSTTIESVTLYGSTPVDFSDNEVDLLIGITFNDIALANAIDFYEVIVTMQ